MQRLRSSNHLGHLLLRISFAAFVSVLVGWVQAPTAQAKNVTISGVAVAPFEQPTLECMVAFQVLKIEHTDVWITSSSFNINQLLGMNVRASGPLIPGKCNIIDVQSFSLADFTVETCGGGALGCTFRMNVTSKSGGQTAVFGATAPGFVPLGPTAGSLLLDPNIFVFLFIYPQTQTVHTFDIGIPADPNIQALTVHLQAARLAPQKPGVVQWSSMDTVFTGTHTTPCFLPGC